MTAVVRVVALVLLVGWSATGAAQREPAGYGALVDLALTEYEGHNFDEARAQFRRAHALFPNARTLRGIGMTEYELRNYGECIESLEEALRSQMRPLEGRLRAETEQLLAKARNYVARVNLDLQPGAATVIVDGIPVTLGEGNTLVLRVGDHVLEFKAEGRTPERRELRVNGGEQQTMRVVLREPTTTATRTASERRVTETTTITAAPDATPERIQPTQHSDAGPLPWILVGVSAAVTITGVVLVAMAQDDIATVEDANKGVRWDEIEGAYDAAPIKSGIGIAMIALGTAGIVSGAVLLLSGSERDDPASTQVAVGLGSVAITGSF